MDLVIGVVVCKSMVLIVRVWDLELCSRVGIPLSEAYYRCSQDFSLPFGAVLVKQRLSVI